MNFGFEYSCQTNFALLLFQASVYSPYCSLDRKFNRNSTYESRYSCFTADNLDKFRRYYAHITSKPRYYSYSVGSTTDDEETNMDDTEDTLTEVSTVNIVIDNANNNTNNDDEDTQTFTSAQDIADDTNDSPTDAKSTQPIEQLNENEQKTVETAETNVLSEENCQQEEKHLKSEELEKKSDVKSPRNSVPNDLMIIKDKPPLQRSLSMPNENNKSMIMLQKSPSRPIFSSSAFYDPEQHPTLEDQVCSILIYYHRPLVKQGKPGEQFFCKDNATIVVEFIDQIPASCVCQ